MKTIVIAASKGGVGKTTLAASLAVEAARKSRTGLIDLDPQQSLARWHDLRSERDADCEPQLIEVGKRPEAAFARARRQHLDWLFVDTPGGSLSRMKLAIDAADLVLLPVRPSPLDVEAMEPVVELCDVVAKPFVFILNGVHKSTVMTEGARTYLETRYGHVLIEQLSLHEAHAEAMLSGATVCELDAHHPAAAEMRALWSKIEQLVAEPASLLTTRIKRAGS